jgi:AraC family transcriptional regulator
MSLSWQDFLPVQPASEKSFSSIGLHFSRIALTDIHYTSTLSGYLISISTGPPCLVTRKISDSLNTGKFAPGDIIITPPSPEILWHISGHAEFINIYASLKYIRLVAESVGIPQQETVFIKDRFQCQDKLITVLCDSIYEQLESQGYHDHIYTEALGRTLFIHLLHNSMEKNALHAKTCKRVFNFEQMEIMRAYIHGRMEERIETAELAKCVNVSDYHFYRIFKRTTGITPQQFIKKCRLEKARHLIEHTSLQFAEIAYQTGFVDQSHMAREFRLKWEITPRQLRDQMEYDQNLPLPFTVKKSSPVLMISSLIQEITLQLFDYLPIQLLA